ncbi:hypothetical protein TNCV_2424171 [Trichonephila clavipes]|nr:hypothetical protein TNCV_2424171 [Trichonephila clavipes]
MRLSGGTENEESQHKKTGTTRTIRQDKQRNVYISYFAELKHFLHHVKAFFDYRKIPRSYIDAGIERLLTEVTVERIGISSVGCRTSGLDHYR